MMKQVFILFLSGLIYSHGFAQGNSGKDDYENNKATQRSKKINEVLIRNDEKRKGSDTKKISSKNQPAKVTKAFERDYPDARNVTWSKYDGNWTASFSSGIVRTTAVYHANGIRKDTRTTISRKKLPG